jgi:hypothetical protein
MLVRCIYSVIKKNTEIYGRDSAAGIATGYGLGDRGVGVRVPVRSRMALRSTQPPIQRVLGALSPGVKRPGREDDHSPPTDAEVKKTWI